MNRVILVGRLVKDPELRRTSTDIPVVQFVLAVNRPFSRNAEQKADFINCVVWRQAAENLAKYMRKGSQIGVEGQLQVRYRKTNEQLSQEADAFIKKVRSCYPNSKLFSILPLWTLWNAQSVDWGEDKRAILKAVYEKNDVHIIDGFKMMPHNIKYIEDGILHPNAEGFRYYGNRVAKVMEEKFLK